ncbi:MAG: type II toxin-antitoxin system HicB family antitoxin [Saprospiraceae bacterium]
MKSYHFTAYIEQDKETGFYVGYIPSIPGAFTQAESLEELQKNLEEVAQLCLEELSPLELSNLRNEYVGTQEVSIAI